MNILEKAKQLLYELRTDGENWDKWEQLYIQVLEMEKEISERKEFIEVYAKAFKEQHGAEYHQWLVGADREEEEEI
jgi:predicted component of type VI protein secretion system